MQYFKYRSAYSCCISCLVTTYNPHVSIFIPSSSKCWKILPRPHLNASIFACYSEERMDICRAMIVGATETPYSMGLFQLDICYPALYPSQAPMVHFMTTGECQLSLSPLIQFIHGLSTGDALCSTLFFLRRFHLPCSQAAVRCDSVPIFTMM